MTKKLNGTVIVTYRCNARCTMCNRYKVPSRPEEEISIETIRKLPQMYFTNITGGEPFIRTDLKDIVRELYKKSDRIVISTNGFFTERIVDLCKEFPEIGIRISIEGLEETNNEIRGLEDGFNRGYTTLKKLREMGMKSFVILRMKITSPAYEPANDWDAYLKALWMCRPGAVLNFVSAIEKDATSMKFPKPDRKICGLGFSFCIE